MNEHWHALPGDEVLKELSSTEQGLTKDEAVRRLETYGENKLPEAKASGYLSLFVSQFASPLIYLLFAAAVILYLTGDRGDALVILFVLLFNSVIGTLQEGRAQNTLQALKHFTETTAAVLRDGVELIVRDCEIVPGDLIILEAGAKVPADARLLVARTLQVDEASLTGESEPVTKYIERVKNLNAPLADQCSMVFKGTNIVTGTGRAVVVATGTNTAIGKIAEKIARVDTDMPLKANIRNLSRAIIYVVGVGGVFLFIAGLLFGNPPATMFAVVIALAVSVIPEGLPIVLTLVLATGVWRMGKKHVLVKRLQAVEALGQAEVIAVDKTGTITKNELMVERVWAEGTLFSVGGAGYDPTGSISLDGATIDAANHPELLLAGKLAAYVASAQALFVPHEKHWRVAGDPTEAALLVFGTKTGFTKAELEHEAPLLSEMPFDYRLKYHATLHAEGEKNLVTVVGAPEAVLALSTNVRVLGKEVPLQGEALKEVEAAVHELSREGLRVIAYACRSTERATLEEKAIENLTLGGLYAMRDALRPEAKDAVERARDAGIRVVMVTGDHKVTATAIARDVGIFREGDEVLTGDAIEDMSDSELTEALSTVTVFARVTPDHKLRIVTAYRARGNVVAMTGDGVNDAPSLVAADLGVSMGAIGTEVAKEAADIVLLDDNFGSIVAAVEEGRSIYKTIKKVVLYLFSTSIGEAFTIVVALFLGLPLPLVAAQIIWLNFVTDSFLDVALGMEPKEKRLLAEPFTRPSPYIIDRLMLVRMLVMALPMVLGTLWIYHHYLTLDAVRATTIAMTTLAVFQWFNAWNCRSDTESLLAINPFRNLYLVGATLVVVLLQVLALSVPLLERMLHTTTLTLVEWGFCIAVASSILVAEELRKLVYRHT